jgi:AraC-like DNA-binding protein
MSFFSGIDFWHAGHVINYNVTRNICGTSYGIQYNHTGKVRLRVAGGKEHREKGAWVFITQPGGDYEYGPCDGESRDHYFICVRGPVIANYIKSGLLPVNNSSPLIKIVHSNKFRQTMLNLEKAIHSHKPDNDRMELMFMDLLLQLHEQSDAYNKFPASQLENFSRLIERIEENPQLEWDFSREAHNFDISLSHFRRLFRQFCDLSPSLFLLNQRLRLAASLLIETSNPVNVIASEVGIDDAYYFSRSFKKKYTVSPSAYRRELVGK